MDKDSLNFKYKMVAENKRTCDDCMALLQQLANDSANVRVKIPGVVTDSFEIRNGIYSYLQAAVDTLRRMSNTRDSRRRDDSDSSEDSV